MSEPKKRSKKKETKIPSLSATEVKEFSNKEIREKVFSSMNDNELEKALDNWLKQNHTETKIAIRDLGVLKTIISEYLDTFITFGYNLNGDRIIIQHFKSARDRDAIMEFLKTIFIKQQHENFLDLNDEE